MSNNEMEEEQDAAMFTDTELLDAIGKYQIVLTFNGVENVAWYARDYTCYNTQAIGATPREAITNCITAIKDEQGENQ